MCPRICIVRILQICGNRASMDGDAGEVCGPTGVAVAEHATTRQPVIVPALPTALHPQRREGSGDNVDGARFLVRRSHEGNSTCGSYPQIPYCVLHKEFNLDKPTVLHLQHSFSCPYLHHAAAVVV